MTMIHPLHEIIEGTTKVIIVDDNAKSHEIASAVPYYLEDDPRHSNGQCRWQSSPVTSSKPKITEGLKLASSIPLASVPSLQSLVSPAHLRYGERHPLEEGESRPSASELLSQYLRLTTEKTSFLDREGHMDDETHTTGSITVSSSQSFTSLSSWDPPPSLTSNVKKPVRRRSLDGSQTQTKF